MKNLILALALCMIATPTFAKDGNDGPNAAQQEQQAPQFIAEVVQGSGFVPHDYPSGTSVGVKENGSVVLTKFYFDGKVKTEVIAKLSKAMTANLLANVNAVSEGELIDQAPNSPGCMDAPTTTYLANGVKVKQRADCKEYLKNNENDADRQVVTTLGSLWDLANLRAPNKN